MRIKITKCYLIQLCDDEEKEIESNYFFGTKAEAEKEGRQMMKDERLRQALFPNEEKEPEEKEYSTNYPKV